MEANRQCGITEISLHWNGTLQQLNEIKSHQLYGRRIVYVKGTVCEEFGCFHRVFGVVAEGSPIQGSPLWGGMVSFERDMYGQPC